MPKCRIVGRKEYQLENSQAIGDSCYLEWTKLIPEQESVINFCFCIGQWTGSLKLNPGPAMKTVWKRELLNHAGDRSEFVYPAFRSAWVAEATTVQKSSCLMKSFCEILDNSLLQCTTELRPCLYEDKFFWGVTCIVLRPAWLRYPTVVYCQKNWPVLSQLELHEEFESTFCARHFS